MQHLAMRKITISLPGDLVELADRIAQQTHTSRSQVISQALAEVRVREQTRLAEEGYRFYAAEAAEFAEASGPLAAEALAPLTAGENEHDGQAW